MDEENSQSIIGYYCRWLSLANKLSIFDDDDDEGWDILPMAIKTLLRSIIRELVYDDGPKSWWLSHNKTYVTCEIMVSHAPNKKHINLHKSIPWPLREERKRNNDTHSTTISRRLEQGNPTNIRCYILIKINCRFDFLEFVLNERINALWRRSDIVQY